MHSGSMIRHSREVSWAEAIAGLAVVATSLLALDIFFLAGQLAVFAIADPGAAVQPPLPRFPSPNAHNAFHFFQETGFSLTASILLFFLAWGPIRRAKAAGVVAVIMSGLPSAVLPVIGYNLFGPWHDYAFHPAVLWALSVATGGLAYALSRRASVSRPKVPEDTGPGVAAITSP